MPHPTGIAITTSRRVDADAPSLLTLPRDIRLIVFEYIFKFNGPFLIHNRNAYHAREPDLFEYMAQEDREETTEALNHARISENGADHEFAHGYNMDTSILLSCREFYHEAATILYGGNTFIFFRVTIRHDIDEDELHDDDAYNPLSYAVQWLHEIGSQHTFLKKVMLDVDSLCPAAVLCDCSYEDVDLLPLARYVWDHPELAHKISFVRSGRAMLIHADEVTADTSSESAALQRVDNLNYYLSELIIKDCLDLKRYLVIDGLLVHIKSKMDERSGLVGFHRDVSRTFQEERALDEDTVTLRLSGPERAKNLSDLISMIGPATFVDMCVDQRGDNTSGMNSRSVKGLDLNLFHVNRQMRFLFQMESLVRNWS